jgi:mRNA-degrading endonuclease RelE of RelBE toxin-antitoxin system
MEFRLFVDADAIDFLQNLPAEERRLLYRHLREIQKYPGNYSNYIEQDEEGRRLDVSAFQTFRVYYWADGADRHVKILEIRVTD